MMNLLDFAKQLPEQLPEQRSEQGFVDLKKQVIDLAAIQNFSHKDRDALFDAVLPHEFVRMVAGIDRPNAVLLEHPAQGQPNAIRFGRGLGRGSLLDTAQLDHRFEYGWSA